MSPTAAAEYRELSLDQVVESTWNPRKHFDETAIAELAQSIAEKGVIEPIVVRPMANPTGQAHFEIVAGARRFRASRKAGLARIPSIVRELDDAAALELAVIENGQREDIHPLDEAAGFEALMEFDAKTYSVPVVAAKVGKSERYVYRRLKLLQLIPPVRRAFEADALTVAHAERMARLSPSLQQDAYDQVLFSPLFRFGQADEDDTTGEKDRIPTRDGLEPLGRLDQFIQEHTAIDPDSEDTRQYFPELEEEIQEAIESESPEQADGSKPATLLKLSASFFPRQQLGLAKSDAAPLPAKRWHEIRSKKDACSNVVAGVIVHGGPLRAVNVCATKGCPKHFPIAKKKRTPSAAAESAPRDTYEEQEKRRQAEAEAWKQLLAAAAPALAQHLAKVKFNAELVRAVVDDHTLRTIEQVFAIRLTDKTAAQVLALSTVRTWHRQSFLQSVKPMKFNLGPIEQRLKAAAKKTAATSAAKATKKGRA